MVVEGASIATWYGYIHILLLMWTVDREPSQEECVCGHQVTIEAPPIRDGPICCFPGSQK